MIFGRRRLHFKSKVPVSYKVAFVLFATSVFFEIGTKLAIPKWSPKVADAVHSYPFAIHGVIYFVQPWIGKYLDHTRWVNAILFGSCDFYSLVA